MPQNLNPSPYAQTTELGISASSVIKEGTGRLFSVNVTTAGAAGAIYDSLTVGDIGAANLIATIPATVGTYNYFGLPFENGLTYVPGASQVVSVSYS
jgi:hypothetical protein